MKSAYEKALERFGKTQIIKLTDEQKEKIAELESLYKAKIAERELLLKTEINKAIAENDYTAYQQLEVQLISEKQKLKEELKTEKNKIRNKY